MSDRPYGSTVANDSEQDNQQPECLTKDFDSNSTDSMVGDFELDDFDAEAAARQFDSQVREQADVSGSVQLNHPRITWVLRLLNETLRYRHSERSGSRSLPIEDGLRGRLELPETIGRFRIGSLLGCGGFGEVYRAHDEVLQRDVALKIIPRPERTPIGEGDCRLNEARAAAHLNHPNLVPLYEVLEAEDFVCLVSELCEGPTLRRYLNEHPGPLEPTWAAEIVRKLADAIAHAHSRGLIHRDIKPGNVILVPEIGEGELLPFSPRLTDFGLVLDTKESLSATGPSRLVGTILYMPPEALMGQAEVDARSGDVYSLGLLLYEMLSGRLPFQASTASGILNKICLNELPSLRGGKQLINRDLQAICFRAMAKRPQQRYESANALVEDLIRYRRGQSVSARPRSWIESGWRLVRNHPQVSMLLALVIGLVIAGTSAMGRKNLRLQEQSTAIETTLSQLLASERQAVHAKRDAIIARDHAAAERDRAEANQREAIGIAYRSDLLMAFTAISRSDIASAVSYLDEIESYLDDSQRQRTDLHLLKTLAHDGWESLASFDSSVEEMVLFPSQKWFATAAAGNRVRIYRAEDAVLIHEIELYQGARIHALAVSADESLLAVGASQPEWLSWLGPGLSWLGMGGDTVSLFPIDVSVFSSASVATVQHDKDVQERFSEFAATVDSLAFHPDGKRLAIGARYEPVEVRWLDGSAETQRLDSTRRNENLLFCENGELIWLAGSEYLARQPTDATEPVIRMIIPQEHFMPSQYLNRVTGSSDGEWIAATIRHASNCWLFKRNAETQKPIVLENEQGELTSICISPACEYVAAGTMDGAVVVWRMPDPDSPNKPVVAISHHILHGSPVGAIVIDDAGQIISGAADGSVVRSQLIASSSAVKTYTFKRQSNSADMTADGKTAVAGCQDGSIWMLDFASGEQTCLRETPNAPFITKVSIASSSQQFAVGDALGSVWFGSLQKPKDLTLLPMQEFDNTRDHDVNAILFSNCSPQLIVGRGPTLVQWVDTNRMQATSAFHAPTGIEAIGMIDGETAFTFGDRIYTTNATTNTEPLLSRSGSGVVVCVCFDPLRQTFFAGGRDGIVRSMHVDGRVLKSSRRWKSSRLPSQASRSISVIAISPDGQNLITGSTAGDCAIWDAETLRPLGTIVPAGDGGEIEQVRFSDDGKVLMIHQRHSAALTAETRGKIQLIRIRE